MKEKLRLLKELYLLKSLGVEYVKPQFSTQKTKSECVGECHLCALSKSRKNIVFGGGNALPKVLFIDTMPNIQEDESGKVFSGRASQMVELMAKNVLKTDKFYLTYLIKCKTPNNRAPSQDEIDTCSPFLLQQISQLNPKVIIAFGQAVYNELTNDTNFKRGVVCDFGQAKLIATHSPSHILRNPSLKKDVHEDLLKATTFL